MSTKPIYGHIDLFFTDHMKDYRTNQCKVCGEQAKQDVIVLFGTEGKEGGMDIMPLCPNCIESLINEVKIHNDECLMESIL